MDYYKQWQYAQDEIKQLRTQLTEAQIKIETLRESKIRVGNVIDKWRNRAVANRSALSEAQEREKVLMEVFKSAKKTARSHLKDKSVPFCTFKRCELCTSVARYDALNHKEQP